MDFYIFFLVVINFINFFLGFLVWQKDKKNIINKSFWIFICCVILWTISLYISDLPLQASHALFWNKLTLTSGLLFASSFVYFCFVFVQKKRFIILKPPFSFITLSLLFFLISITLFTNLIVARIEFFEWGTNIIPGKLYFLVGGFYLLAAILGLGNLILKYKKSTGVEKNQIQYLFLGFLLASIGILTTNLIQPAITGTNPYAKYGPFFVTFFIFFTALAITRYHLFGIEVILTEVLVGVIGILLLIQIFVAPTITWKIVNGIIFLLFCIFGYLLIRGVFREIRRREELERISRAKSEFISITSHQLRTPLTAIKGYLSMVLEGSYGEISERVKKVLEKVYQSNERLIKLVNSFLNVSKIELGREELKLEEVSIEDLISETISEIEIETKKKNLYLNFEKPKISLPKILIDRGRIKEVILNLIDNAIKYTQEGGITVKLKTQNSKLKIIISDTGEGLTKEEISKLFESFSRGTAGTKFWTEGVGLGLYLARKFVEMHKGKIWAESEGKGKGSTFYIELPIKQVIIKK